ncbi:MAG: PEP-CTERM system TPR-repeat protein PrsT [Gammaproteobacteria bacterium]|nr:PEP-CTERM system TPR-repeat protein PrsT [Gammaproteobacteria bacterium]
MRLLTILLLTVTALGGCDIGVDDATRMQRAQTATENADYRAAAIELKNVLRNDPTNVDARALLGKVMLKSGDPGSALKELQKAAELGAEESDFLLPLAQALAALDRYGELLEIDPDDLDTAAEQAALQALQGDALVTQREFAAAEARYEAALDLAPEMAGALVGLASVRLAEGDVAGAETAIQEVIERHTDMHKAYAVLARLQMNKAEYAAAEQNINKAIELATAPSDRRDRLNYLASKVDALLAQDKAGQAQDAAASLLEMAPQHPFALFQSARADYEAGQFDSVIDKTQQVIAVNPGYQPAQLLLAAGAMAKENFALAEMHLRTLVNNDPGNTQARKLLAQASMNLGNPEDALAALQPLIDANQVDPALLTMAGSAQIRSGDRDAGLELLNRGVAASGGDPSTQFRAAASLLAAGESSQALALLQSMPEDSRGYEWTAMTVLAYARSGQAAAAKTLAEQFVGDNSDDANAYRILGGYFAEVEDFDNAVAQFRKGLSIDPANEVLVIGVAQLEFRRGNHTAAKEQLNALLRESPGNLRAYVGLAELAAQTGDQAGAIELLEKARSANPDAFGPAVALSRAYLATGRPQLALERAREAAEIAANNPEVLTALGTAQTETGRHSEALGSLERALQLAPGSVEAQFQLARTQLRLGMDDAAMTSLRQTLSRSPNHLGAQVAIARIEGLRGNYARALEVVQSLKESHAERAEPYVLEGDVHIMRGHFNDAIDAYDRAAGQLDNATITVKRYDARKRAGRADSHIVLETYLESHPDDYATRVVLAQAFANNDKTEMAINEYQRVLAKQPDNLIALNNLAWLYAELGGPENLAKGVDIASRARAAAPANGAIVDTYGWLLLQQGKVDEATDMIRDALSLSPDNPEIRYHLAVALHRSGAAREARDLLDSLLSESANFSGRDEARALRDDLYD